MSGSIYFSFFLCSRIEKPFGLSWNQTQVLLPHRQPLQPVDHASFDRMRLSVRLLYSNTYISRWTMTALWYFFTSRDFQLCIFTVSKNSTPLMTSNQSLWMKNSFRKKTFSIFLFLILFIDPIKSPRTLWTVKLEFIFLYLVIDSMFSQDNYPLLEVPLC